MKVTSKGFEITEVCEVGGTLRFDGEVLRLDESSLAHSVGYSLDDVTKLIEALTEARRLMALSAVTPSRPRRLKDGSGDIWALDANGETYTCEGYANEPGGNYVGWTRARLDRIYTITELPD